MFNRVLFFWKIGLYGLVLSSMNWFMYHQGMPEIMTWYVLPLFMVMPFFFSLSYNAVHDVSVRTEKVFAWLGGFWFIFTLYSAMASFFCGFVYALLQLAAPALWDSYGSSLIRLLFLAVLLLMAYGIFHALHPKIRTIRIESGKIQRKITLAFATDIHLSPIQSRAYARRLVERLNGLSPDLVIFGGDIIDAHLDFVLRDGSYKAFQHIRAPLGTWAVFGNHDFFDGNIKKEAAMFHPLRFLAHEQVSLLPGLVLTGLNDYMHYPSEAVPPCDPSGFNILIDHEPLHIGQAEEKGYDLYLGGHTHAGQFFPVTFITRRMYVLNYGLHRFRQMTAYVSSGYGAWGFPFRTGPYPEILRIELFPAEKETGKEA